MTLPFTIDRNPQTHQGDDENASDISLAGMSIMLVEDNELNTEIARTLLENEGAQVTCAADGQEAVDLFCSKTPGTFDVILMDVMMPKMNGYEATRAIRLSDRPDAATVPIVAMTANAFAEDVQTAKEAGMNDHVSKPIQLDILKEALAKYRHG
ncbi:response regulator [Senegalimassilia sp.]